MVLVDQSTEPISSADPAAGIASADGDRRSGWVWAFELESSVRTVVVMVLDVFSENSAHVSFTEDEQMINALAPDASDQPFGVPVGLWRLDRGEHNLDVRSGAPR